MPPRTALAISEGGDPQYRIGPVGGPLTLHLSGSGTVQAEAADSLQARLSGSQRLLLGRLDGEASLAASGSVETTIQQAELRRLDASLNGSATLSVAGGRIGSGSIQGAGSGGADIDAATGDMSVALAGSGTVRLARQEGRLTQSTAGSARILVGSSGAEPDPR